MHHLYLIDDNINNFKYVSDCLIEIMQHVPTQAEQCCVIANNNGKCHIKKGDYMELLELKENFDQKNIQVEITSQIHD